MIIPPYGSVLRAKYAGWPTRDSLFEDPVMDERGAGNWPLQQKDENLPVCSTISGHISPLDVEFLEEVAGEYWAGDCAVYAFYTGTLTRLPKKGYVKVSLSILKCEVYTVSPIRIFGDVHFAPIGLLDMYNSGGATETLNCSMDSSKCTIKIKARGCGLFGAYSSEKPSRCLVDKKEEEFTYNPKDGLLKLYINEECKSWDIEAVY